MQRRKEVCLKTIQSAMRMAMALKLITDIRMDTIIMRQGYMSTKTGI